VGIYGIENVSSNAVPMVMTGKDGKGDSIVRGNSMGTMICTY
tara:strand:- start:121 stop:246 length:126 start_codon:yes stop_codon:yes gene_type:complete